MHTTQVMLQNDPFHKFHLSTLIYICRKRRERRKAYKEYRY
uniref:Uncharacterized protein n=1 Tax=Brassica oleracea TaxID=3712 RepID=A0A3P6DZB7_BRAOL|nr:unnamed protein product [Brassica oleracea]